MSRSVIYQRLPKVVDLPQVTWRCAHICWLMLVALVDMCHAPNTGVDCQHCPYCGMAINSLIGHTRMYHTHTHIYLYMHMLMYKTEIYLIYCNMNLGSAVRESSQHPEVLEKTSGWSQALRLFQPKEADLISRLEFTASQPVHPAQFFFRMNAI